MDAAALRRIGRKCCHRQVACRCLCRRNIDVRDWRQAKRCHMSFFQMRRRGTQKNHRVSFLKIVHALYVCIIAQVLLFFIEIKQSNYIE